MYSFYWLPIGTDVRVRAIPWATVSLAVADIMVFAALHSIAGAEAFAYRVAFKPGEPTVPTAIASLFIHAAPLDLIQNMLFLALFGPPLESRLGPVRFGIAFIGCGWLAHLAQAAWIMVVMPGMASIPILGASGAISGLTGLFVVRLYFARLRFAAIGHLLLRGALKPGTVTLPAAAGIGCWFALQILRHADDAFPETAVIAHLGGLLTGILFGWSLGLVGEGKVESHLAQGSRRAAEGEWVPALAEYEAYLEAAPNDAEAIAEVARIQRVMHEEAMAADSFSKAIHLWLRRGENGRACDAYDEMKRLLGPVELPAEDLLRVARACEQLGRYGDASRAYEAFGRHYPDWEGAAAALLKSAEIE